MHSIRLALLIVFSIVGAHIQLSADPITASTDKLTLINFPESYNAIGNTIRLSGGPTVDGPLPAVTVLESPSWVRIHQSDNGRKISFGTESARSSPASGIVRLRIADQVITIQIKSIYVDSSELVGFAFNEVTDYAYLFFRDTVVVTAGATSELIDYYVFPNSLLGNDTLQAPSLSADGKEVAIYFPGTRTYARFDSTTLALLASSTIPAAPIGFDRSRSIGVKHNDLLYSVCLGERNLEDQLLLSYFSIAALEVRSARDNSLLQILPLSSIGNAAANSLRIEAITRHPERDELWVAVRTYEGNSSGFYPLTSIYLLRYALLADGTIERALTPPKLLTDKDPYHALNLNQYPIDFLPARNLVAYLNYLLDEASLEPVSVPAAGLAAGHYHLCFTPDFRYSIIRAGVIDLNSGTGHDVFSRADYGVLSSDGRTFTYAYETSVKSVDLLSAALSIPANQVRTPLADQVVFPTDRLSWKRLPGATAYRVYLATEADALSPLVPDTAWLLGDFTETELLLPAPLSGVKTYFWRVDPISEATSYRGPIQSFTVSRVRADTPSLAAYTVFGSLNTILDFNIETESPAYNWNIETTAPWLSFSSPSAGQGPATVTLRIDATGLPVGSTQTNLTLHTTDGLLTLPLNLSVSKLSPQNLGFGDGSPYLYGLNFSYSSSTDGTTHLIRVEAATGTVTHSRLFSIGSNNTVPCGSGHPSGSDKFYVSSLDQQKPNALRRLHSFSAENLAPLGEISIPESLSSRSDAFYGGPHPAPDGKLWIIAAETIGLLDPRTDQIATFPLPSSGERTTYPLPSAVDLKIVQIVKPHNNGQSFTARSITLDGSTWQISPETELPMIRYSEYDKPYLVSTPDLSRLIFNQDLLDQEFRTIAPSDWGYPQFLTPDGRILNDRLQTYEGPNLSSSRILPKDALVITYHPPSERVLFLIDGRLRSIPLTELSLIRPVTLSALPSPPSGLAMGLTWPEVPDNNYVKIYFTNVHFRPVGSDEWMEAQTSTSWDWMGRFTNKDSRLLPETAYELRVRVSTNGVGRSHWSNTVTATTAPLAPRLLDSNSYWPKIETIEEGSLSRIPVAIIGNQITWNVTGLPEGLAFDPETSALVGKPTNPGEYSVTATARNDGGNASQSFTIKVTAASLRDRTATYHGIQAYEIDPLVGSWRVTRTGKRFTGSIRTFVGSGSFSADLNRPDAGFNYVPNTIGKSFKTKIDDVSVRGYLKWNTLTDRCEVAFEVANYGSTTLVDTGFPSHYSKTNPLPWAGRHTALLLPDQEPEDPIPPAEAPEGAGTLLIDLSTTGTARITGESALGQKITHSGMLDRNGTIPIFLPASATHFWGLLASTAPVATPTDGPPIQGALVWVKYDSKKSASYPEGFGQALFIFGNRLPATGKTLPPLLPLDNPDNQAVLTLENGGLERLSKPISQTLVTADNGFILPEPGTPENPNRVTLKLNPASGLVTGSVALLDPTGKKTLRTVQFRGAFIKDPLADGEDVIGGYFTLPDATGKLRSGSFQIAEPEAAPAP